MNALKKQTTPPWPALVLGIPAMVLMVLLMRTGRDSRDLLIPGHFAGILLWVLTAAMTALTFFSVQHYGGKAKYSRMFPPSTPGAIGILGAAVGAFWSAWEIWGTGSTLLEPAIALLGLVSAVALVYLAWCRFRGLRSSFLLWSIVTVFLMMRLMFSYREWSSQPELLRYCFALFSAVCTTLAFYYRTAFSVGLGSRRMYLFFTQLGAFFCLIVLGAGFDLYTLGMLLWCLLDLTSLHPLHSGAREEQP